MFLHEEHSVENLFPAIRDYAVSTFRKNDIAWHDGPSADVPSNYLMDSMVSCVNCLIPFATDPAATAALFAPFVPAARAAVAIDGDAFVAFEWLGAQNYLEEKSPKRKRGSHGTSPDAHVVLERENGSRVGILLEWKYTESYSKGASFGKHYSAFLEAPDSPIDLGGLAPDVLFYEPFYQLARTILLADRMERARENGVTETLVLVVVPEGNRAYRDTITSPELRGRGESVAEVMQTLLRRKDRLLFLTPGDLLTQFPRERFPAIRETVSEALARYVARR